MLRGRLLGGAIMAATLLGSPPVGPAGAGPARPPARSVGALLVPGTYRVTVTWRDTAAGAIFSGRIGSNALRGVSRSSAPLAAAFSVRGTAGKVPFDLNLAEQAISIGHGARVAFTVGGTLGSTAVVGTAYFNAALQSGLAQVGVVARIGQRSASAAFNLGPTTRRGVSGQLAIRRIGRPRRVVSG